MSLRSCSSNPGEHGEMLDLSFPESSSTAWAFLGTVTVALTGLGMWLFARSEYRDDV